MWGDDEEIDEKSEFVAEFDGISNVEPHEAEPLSVFDE